MSIVVLFFFNDTATTEIYTLSLHDALPIYVKVEAQRRGRQPSARVVDGAERVDQRQGLGRGQVEDLRSEEHTSELQSQFHLVCRLLLEKKNHIHNTRPITRNAINASTLRST